MTPPVKRLARNAHPEMVLVQYFTSQSGHLVKISDIYGRKA